MSLNNCTISGNLGKAAELRYTNSQLAVVSFSVAVNERRKPWKLPASMTATYRFRGNQ